MFPNGEQGESYPENDFNSIQEKTVHDPENDKDIKIGLILLLNKDNKKQVSPPLSTNDLSDLKHLDAGNGKIPKPGQGSSVITGLAPLTSNLESSQHYLSCSKSRWTIL